MTDRLALTQLEQFAEFLSQGLTILDIRKRMCLTDSAAVKHMKQIRADLGWQCG